MIRVRTHEVVRSSEYLTRPFIDHTRPYLKATFLIEAEGRGELGLVNDFVMKLVEPKEVEAHDLVALEMLLSIPFYMRGKAFEMFWNFYRMSNAEQDVVKDFMLDMKSGRKSG